MINRNEKKKKTDSFFPTEIEANTLKKGTVKEGGWGVMIIDQERSK